MGITLQTNICAVFFQSCVYGGVFLLSKVYWISHLTIFAPRWRKHSFQTKKTIGVRSETTAVSCSEPDASGQAVTSKPTQDPEKAILNFMSIFYPFERLTVI